MTSTFFSDLFRDFLSAAASISAGVPANDVLKKQSLSDAKVAKPPRLLVNVDPDPERKHPNKIVFDASIVITVESGIHVRATTEAWMRAIRERLVEGEDYPFQVLEAWIQANRTEQQRTGWQIARLRLFASDEDFANEDEMKTYSLSLPIRLTIRLS
jgi:hypothetical protein